METSPFHEPLPSASPPPPPASSTPTGPGASSFFAQVPPEFWITLSDASWALLIERQSLLVPSVHAAEAVALQLQHKLNDEAGGGEFRRRCC